ncbi:hypothetical protein [Mongoliibacter ruber]|uniref:Uncharacterized protein n=1 Tax=Mongoliibacter ruber TaxID=1750599 RepID=A0A2T0WV72_9BACT|nr:hypothetical protein [Mongoliibacter ruber]PRY90592.1 hypothetical protein CLW00_101256 [Mongoliibacter ruber]
MERISLITSLYIGLASHHPQLTLTDGFPSAQDLIDFFKEAPLVLERSDIREESNDTDQGDVISFAVRSTIPRDSDYHSQFAGKEVMAYLTTANGERHFLGSDDTPMTFQYTRDSGAGNADNRETIISLSLQIPLI